MCRKSLQSLVGFLRVGVPSRLVKVCFEIWRIIAEHTLQVTWEKMYFICSSFTLFASALQPDQCRWKKDFGTFGFHVSSCENLQMLNKIHFGAVEWCYWNWLPLSGKNLVRYMITKQFCKMENSWALFADLYIQQAYVT
jgi:hypothetical protein